MSPLLLVRSAKRAVRGTVERSRREVTTSSFISVVYGKRRWALRSEEEWEATDYPEGCVSVSEITTISSSGFLVSSSLSDKISQFSTPTLGLVVISSWKQMNRERRGEGQGWKEAAGSWEGQCRVDRPFVSIQYYVLPALLIFLQEIRFFFMNNFS